MSGVANGDSPDWADEFMPGLRWRGNPAPGSVPSRTVPPDHAPPDSDSGSPGNGAPTPLDEQAIDGRNASPQTRGQNDGSIIMGSAADEDGFTDTGAAGGTTDAWGRFPWQQSPGGR